MRKILAILLLLLTTNVFANEQYKILVGFPPGGGQYLIGSIIQKGFRDEGINSILVTKPGAGGVIALNECIKNADPLTLCLVSQSQLVFSSKLNSNIVNYDSKNLTYVKLIGSSPMVLVTYKDNFKNIDEIIHEIRYKEVNLGGGALGNSYVVNQFLGFLKAFKSKNIEYNGVGAALKDLIGKHISYVIAPYTAVKSQIDSNSIRLVASFSNKIHFSNIPVIDEFVVPDTIFGFVANESINESAIQTQKQALSRILNSDKVKISLLDQGIFILKDDNDVYFKREIIKQIEKITN